MVNYYGFHSEYITIQKSCTRIFYSKNHYQILFIFSGQCSFTINNITFGRSAESIVVVSPDTQVRCEFISGKYPLEIMQTMITVDFLNQLSDDEIIFTQEFDKLCLKSHTMQFSSKSMMVARNIAFRVSELYKDDRFGNKIYRKGLVSVLLVQVIRAFLEQSENQGKIHKRQFILDDIFAFIGSHIDEEISLDRLAQTFFVSKYHIAREFKKQTGTTVHQYILKQKLDLCKQHLATGVPTTEICHLCGFGGYNHMLRVFKKEFGMTPRDYIKRQ